MRRAHRSQAGLTLVELMIATVILGIVIAAALAMGFSMMSNYREHRAMVMVERSARVSLEIISGAARGSSPGVPLGRVEDLIGCGGQVGLRVVNASNAPDEIEIAYAAGGVLTSLRAPYGPTSTTMTVLDATNLAAGDYVLVTNVNDGAAIVEVTDVQPNGTEYDLTTGNPTGMCGAGITAGAFPAAGFDVGALVIRAKLAHFFVLDDASVANIPTLMMDPDGAGPLDAEPMAEGVEDLQVAIGVDVDGDGTVSELGLAPDDDEWFYNVAGDSDPDPAMTWRAIRITLVARTTSEKNTTGSYVRPAVEDRPGSAAPDAYRRRVLSTTVEIRNLAGSP